MHCDASLRYLLVLGAKIGVWDSTWHLDHKFSVCVCDFNVGMSISGCCGRNKDPPSVLSPFIDLCLKSQNSV